MNFLDFLIKINKRDLYFELNCRITNRLAVFLMVNSKGFRFYTDNELFLREECMYSSPIKSECQIEKSILDSEFKSFYETELKKAFENPQIEYEKRMRKAKENYLEYRKEIELRRLFSN